MKQVVEKIRRNVKGYFNTNVLFITFVLSSVINASILRFFTVKNYFDFSPMIADFAVVIIIGAFGYLLKPKNQFKYFFGWSIFFTLICIINSVYYTNFLSFVSLSLVATSKQLIGVTDAVFENIMEPKDFVFLWQIVAMLFVNHYLKKQNYYTRLSKVEDGKISTLMTLVGGLICVGFFISTLSSTDISRLGKQWNRELVVMKYGLYTYHINDAIASLKPQISPLFGYDSAAKEFREYYEENKEETKTNEYTDTLKGKNIIVIHAESFQQFLIGKTFNGIEVTPNMNKLASEGLYFSNFYAQESTGTSSDSEFTFNTSLLPASSGTVFVNYFDREYVTIPKLLKEQGYYTFSMHGNNGTYWNRNVMHENMGYDYFFYYTKDFEIDERIGLGLSDKSFFRQVVPKIKTISEEHEKFYGVTIMLTNHTPFSDINDRHLVDFDVDYKYEKVNEETGETEIVSAPYLEGTKLGNYIKSVHYADAAIGQFIEDLDAAGLLENTAIVIYGDHDAKVKQSEYVRYYNYDPYTDSILSEEDPNYVDVDYYNYELNRKVPFIIWTKDNQAKTEITKVMGMYDVLPTLGNMMGFSSPYALGHDIFSIDENVVIFPSGNWLTDKVYYYALKEEWKVLNQNDTISMEYIEKYTKKAEDALSVSNDIIVYDLIKKTKETDALKKEYNGGFE